MAQSFQCTIVTPARQVLDEQVTYVSVPAHDGLMGVAPHRAPLVAKLGVGALRLDPVGGGASRWYYIGGGFVQMNDNRLTLLANEATEADKLNREEAQAALKEAQARVPHSDEEFDHAQRDLAKARTKLQLAKS